MKPLLTILFAVLFSSSLLAQEEQVALDEEGQLEYLNAEKSKRLNLYPQYNNIQEIRLYKDENNSFILEVIYLRDDKRLKVREPLSYEEVQELRQKVSHGLYRQEASGDELNQDGRTSLIIGSSVVSLAHHGIAVPIILDVESGTGATGLYMLTSATGIITSILATQNQRVTYANAHLSVYGQTRGIFHGIAFTALLNENASTRSYLASSLLFSIGEGIGGFMWADRTNMSYGQASAIGVYSDFGLGLGIGLSHTAGVLNQRSDGSAVAATALLGSVGGLITGAYLSKSGIYTRGDAEALGGAGFLGTLLPVSIALAVESDNPRTYWSMATFGAAGGLLIGHILARENEFTSTQGSLINLGALAGGLVGGGVGYLSTGDNFKNFNIIPLTASIGAIAGYALMASHYHRTNQAGKKGVSLDIDLRPEGLMSLKNPEMYKGRLMPPSMLNVSLRF